MTKQRQGSGVVDTAYMKADILLVEDEPDLAEPLIFALEQDGHTVRSVSTGAEGLAVILGEEPPDAVLLDLMLPDVSGLEVCRTVRATPRVARMPVVLITARTDEYDKVIGFEAGADDYITKPFSLREVRLRVQAMLRRTREVSVVGSELKSGVLAIDEGQHVATLRGEALDLTVLEFRLLATFVRHMRIAMTRDQIRQRTWGDEYAISERAVDTNVRRLRSRLGNDGHCVETVRGIGYRWSPPEE
jgi:two-component system, OmpR family, phosphate regulon response regulator PhoB